MALKITSQIGTDLGITSEAYVRIADYQISKSGSANFRIELFQSQNDSELSTSPVQPIPGVSSSRRARNQQIGESLFVQMTRLVQETVTVKRSVPVEVEFEEEVPGVDAEGNSTTTTVTRTRIEMQEEDVEQAVTRVVPDLSEAEGIDVFAFGYGKLKAKLQELFGEANVVDC